jgi:hypothetical protein
LSRKWGVGRWKFFMFAEKVIARRNDEAIFLQHRFVKSEKSKRF